MNLLIENIKRLLHNQNKDEKNFCSEFGVQNLQEINLEQLENVAYQLNTTLDILVKKTSRKPFPKNIELLILDVDGVMTDTGLYYTENGDMMKKFNAKDGMGILQLTKTGFQVGIISNGFKGDLVKKRADTLRIQNFYLGREHKINILKQWCAELKIGLHQVAMIGDDVNDLEVMQAIGYSACPSDAASKILQKVDCILNNKGGEGCVREFIEEVMGVEIGYLP